MNLDELIESQGPAFAELRQVVRDKYEKQRAKDELKLKKRCAKLGIANFKVSHTEISCTLDKLCFTYKGHQIEVTPFVEFDGGWWSGFDLTIDDTDIDIHELNDGYFEDGWCDFGHNPRSVDEPEFQELVYEIVDAYLKQEAL